MMSCRLTVGQTAAEILNIPFRARQITCGSRNACSLGDMAVLLLLRLSLWDRLRFARNMLFFDLAHASQTIDAHGACVPPVLFWHLALPRLPPARRAFFCEGYHCEPTFHHFGGIEWVIPSGHCEQVHSYIVFHLSARAVIPNAAIRISTICFWKWPYKRKPA